MPMNLRMNIQSIEEKKQHICSAIDKQIKTIKQKPRITKLMSNAITMSNAISSSKKKNQLQTLTFTQTGYCLAFMISKQLAKLFVTQPTSNRPSESQHYTQNRVNKPNTTKHAMCSGQTILLWAVWWTADFTWIKLNEIWNNSLFTE